MIMKNFETGEQVISKSIGTTGVITKIGDYAAYVDPGIGKVHVYYLDDLQHYPKNKIILDIINDL
jgi:hypothetical protein